MAQENSEATELVLSRSVQSQVPENIWIVRVEQWALEQPELVVTVHLRKDRVVEVAANQIECKDLTVAEEVVESVEGSLQAEHWS